MGFAQPPVIFLVAGPRGRSPVSRLLDTHKRVAVVPDSVWITDLASHRRSFEAPGGAKMFAEAFIEHHVSGAWGFTPDEIRKIVAEDGEYIALVRSILNAYADKNDANVLVDASPHVAANLHLLTLLTKRARVLVIREPDLAAEAPVRTGYAMWLAGRDPIDDVLATLERSRWTATRLDELLKDPVGVIRTLIAYLEVGVALDGFTAVEGMPVATKPGRVMRLGPQKPGEKEIAPVRMARAFLDRYPGIARRVRVWAERNRPLVNKTLKKIKRVSR